MNHATRHALRFLVSLALLLAVMVPAASASRGPQPPPQPAETATPQVEVLWNGIWWDAKIVGERADALKVHYLGWAKSYDEWVPDRRIRQAHLDRLQSARRGQRVEINWRGGWWPGRVIKARSGRAFITYDGYGRSWDQWVAYDKLRVPRRGES